MRNSKHAATILLSIAAVILLGSLAVRFGRKPQSAERPATPVPSAAPVASATPAALPSRTSIPLAAGITPAPAPRTIRHQNAQMLLQSETTADEKRVGALALQVENNANWSSDPDPEAAGAADGAAALQAFNEAGKTFVAVPTPGKRKRSATTSLEASDRLKEQVRNIVCLDTSEAFGKEPQSNQAYRDAFVSAFNRDEQTEAGEKPRAFVRDGPVDAIDDYIKHRINDPGSYQFLRCWQPILTKADGRWAWQMKYGFRAANGSGGVATQIAFVTIRHGQVIGFETGQSK